MYLCPVSLPARNTENITITNAQENSMEISAGESEQFNSSMECDKAASQDPMGSLSGYCMFRHTKFHEY